MILEAIYLFMDHNRCTFKLWDLSSEEVIELTNNWEKNSFQMSFINFGVKNSYQLILCFSVQIRRLIRYSEYEVA
jgi:hypothetical protein